MYKVYIYIYIYIYICKLNRKYCRYIVNKTNIVQIIAFYVFTVL